MAEPPAPPDDLHSGTVIVTDVEEKPKGPEGRFQGKVKSYNESKGWGFIECEETHKLFKRDVFLTKSHARSLKVGSRVEFAVTLNGPKGEPHALDTIPLDPKEPVAFKVLFEQPIFSSAIKTYFEAKGFGFIEPVLFQDATAQDVPPVLQDVFLHKNQIPKNVGQTAACVGTPCYFHYDVVEGKPQARGVIEANEARFGALILDSGSCS